LKILQAALKKAHIGEHRDRGSAAHGVGARQRQWIEILDQHALGWRCLLDLGDQRHAAGPAQRRIKCAWRWCGGDVRSWVSGGDPVEALDAGTVMGFIGLGFVLPVLAALGVCALWDLFIKVLR